MSRCSSCKQSEYKITKKGIKKRKRTLHKRNGMVLCEDCLKKPVRIGTGEDKLMTFEEYYRMTKTSAKTIDSSKEA